MIIPLVWQADFQQQPEDCHPLQTNRFLSLLTACHEAGRRGNLALAGKSAADAAAIAGDDGALLAQAAIALAKNGQMLLAHQTIAPLLARPNHHDKQTMEWLAAAMHSMRCYRAALAYARLAAADPAPPLSAFFQATLELFCGNLDEAEGLLESCIRSAPDMASAHWTLSKLRRQTTTNNHVDRLRRQIRSKREGDESLPYLLFALFKELDDIGETKEAWQALVHGCLSWRRSVRYDIDRDLAGMEGLANAFPQPLAAPRPAEDGSRPVFIVGLPRSGTTLVERILSGHSDVHACGELDDLPATMVLSAGGLHFDIPAAADAKRIADAEPSAMARRYSENTAWRANSRSRLTDKRPNNFLYIGAINRTMPHARIIHVHKQPLGGCFSLLKEFFGGRYNYSYRLNELAAYHNGYRRLMQHWQDSGHEFLDVSYERLVAQPEAEARRILGYCELDWQEQCVRTERTGGVIATASVAQARAAVSTEYVEGWKRYEPGLEGLRDLLVT